MGGSRTAEEAQEEIRRLAWQRRVRYTTHALFERMPARGVRRADVLAVLKSPSSCRPSEGERWRVEGLDTADDELTVVVAIEDNVVVVTVF